VDANEHLQNGPFRVLRWGTLSALRVEGDRELCSLASYCTLTSDADESLQYRRELQYCTRAQCIHVSLHNMKQK